MSIVVLFSLFAILLAFTVPIGIAMGIATLVTISMTGLMTTSLFAREIITSLDSFTLLAIPFFILAGEIMGRGGISDRLLRVANSLVGNITGGFAMATIVACMFFGAIVGSGTAGVVAIGVIMIPAMVERGYNKAFATATVAAAGTLGVIIPPSISMVMIGSISNVSIADMFIAGIIPGILVGLTLMMWAYVYSKRHGLRGTGEKTSLKRIFKELNDAKWALFMPIIILGGIYGGVFTPTEAAAVAVAYGLIVSLFIYKEIKLIDFPKIFISTAGTVGVVMLITATATAFGRYLTLAHIPSLAADALLNISDNPIILIMLINIFLLFIGTFMDVIAAIIILVPILLPIAIEIGLDPVHFAIIMVVNLAIGQLTPPIGANLFVASAISDLPIEKIALFVLPYVISMLITLMIITLVPQISLFLLSF